MPFTPAHAAAVLPLRRLRLPMAALVVGSMVPDVPLFVPWGPRYTATHSLLGIGTLDVVTGLLALVVWFHLVRDAAVDLAPDGVRRRLAPHRWLTRREWLLAVPALVTGASTHVLWDSFTHHGRWGAELVPWLAQRHGSQSGSQWAQYVSGVLGLVVVAAYAVRELRRLPALSDRARRRLPRWALAMPFVLAGGAGMLAAALHLTAGTEVMAYRGVVSAMAGGLLAALLLACGWHAVGRAYAR